MEVLRHGNTYKETECSKCGALLSYCNKDVKTKFNVDDYFGEIHTCRREWIVCPECHKEINLSFKIDGEEQVK